MKKEYALKNLFNLSPCSHSKQEENFLYCKNCREQMLNFCALCIEKKIVPADFDFSLYDIHFAPKDIEKKLHRRQENKNNKLSLRGNFVLGLITAEQLEKISTYLINKTFNELLFLIEKDNDLNTLSNFLTDTDFVKRETEFLDL